MNKSINTNQTQFGTEQPMFEPEVSLPPDPNQVQPIVPWYKQKIIVIFGLFIGLLVGIILLLAVVASRQNSGNTVGQPETTPTPPVKTDQSDLQKRVTRLKADLDQADPTKQDLTFPPVNLNLRID